MGLNVDNMKTDQARETFGEAAELARQTS